MWSPLATLGNVTPNSSSHPPSRLGDVTTPSESSNSSLQTTPLPNLTGEKKFSYSPTASVEGACEVVTASIRSNASEFSLKESAPSPLSSGRTSPIRSAISTPRTFRHIVNDIFRRKNVSIEDKEDFTNISASELEAIMADNGSKKESLTRSETMAKDYSSASSSSKGLVLSLRVPESSKEDSSGQPGGLVKPFPPQLPMSLPDYRGVSGSGVPAGSGNNQIPSTFSEDTLLRASDKLSSLKEWNQSSETMDKRYHKNSFITSYESLATLTPHEEELGSSLLIHRTVSSSFSSSSSPNRKDSSTGGIVGVVSSPLSPAASLDEYIQNGNVLHVGRLQDVSVTDLTGIDWDYFGGCPHSEELKIKTGLAAILHSQVLFERYQCRQHARRNRRLMSKARTTAKLESEVLSLVRLKNIYL